MLEDVKGIGPKTVGLLNKLGIKTIDDLINYYPFRYNKIELTNLSDGEVIVNGLIETAPMTTYIKRNLNKMVFRVMIENYLVDVVIFNRAFMKNNLRRGKEITLIGEYDSKKNSITCQDIRFNKITGSTIEPVYRLTQGISSRVLNQFIISALETNPVMRDYIPDYLIEKYEFLDKEEAIKLIHNPTNDKIMEEAINRLKYEELFKFLFKINYLKANRKEEIGLKRDKPFDKVYDFINDLPFELTKDQVKAYEDILDDLTNPSRMNRLLLGDVGSGKTIVCVIAIFYNFLSGYQSALLAPTEILATQHFYNINKLFKKYNIRVELLKGGMRKKEKELILEDLKSGDIDLLIGTHAMLEGNVEFNNLGLVITDEQHRFGVNQRSVFQNKGVLADVLYMSATPIPRTYALTIYGDMDISLIKTKPKGRLPIKTSLIKNKDIKEALYMMLDEIKEGHQIYIVSPYIESEEDELKDVKKLKQNIDTAFNNKIPSEILHGRLKPAEKEKVMENFKNGITKILISTTVIEVGVDVSNATMMVIFNAERFGLATLHQLRGRIGRNALESKCILVSDKQSKRLEVLTESDDGFYISEMDFKLRGEGDLFGTRQSGDMTFKIANLQTDIKLVSTVNVDSSEFIKENIKNNFENYDLYAAIEEELSHID